MRSAKEQAGPGVRTNVRHLLHGIASLEMAHHSLLLRGRDRRRGLLRCRSAAVVWAARGPAGNPHWVWPRVLGRHHLRDPVDARPRATAPVLAHALPV